MSSKSISETSNDMFIMKDPLADYTLNDAEKIKECERTKDKSPPPKNLEVVVEIIYLFKILIAFKRL